MTNLFKEILENKINKGFIMKKESINDDLKKILEYKKNNIVISSNISTVYDKKIKNVLTLEVYSNNNLVVYVFDFIESNNFIKITKIDDIFIINNY